MKRESAIDLRDQLTAELRLLGFTTTSEPPEDVASAEPLPIGLGIKGGLRGEWLVAVRVYAPEWTKETRAALATIRMRAHGEVDAKVIGTPVLQAGGGGAPGVTLRSGCRIGTTNERWGTVGWFVTLVGRESAGPQALTCAHVLARDGSASVDDLIVVPPLPNAAIPTHTIVGTVSAVAHVAPPWKHIRVDAAAVQPNSETAVDLSVGTRGPVREVLVPGHEETVVVKHGGATAATLGALTAQKLAVPCRDPRTGASMVFLDQYEIESTDPTGRFSRSGDSGSLVLEPRSHQGVAMLIGGHGPFSYATPLNTVLTELNASPA